MYSTYNIIHGKTFTFLNIVALPNQEFAFATLKHEKFTVGLKCFVCIWSMEESSTGIMKQGRRCRPVETLT